MGYLSIQPDAEMHTSILWKVKVGGLERFLWPPMCLKANESYPTNEVDHVIPGVSLGSRALGLFSVVFYPPLTAGPLMPNLEDRMSETASYQLTLPLIYGQV